jgi:hypothetical protein
MAEEEEHAAMTTEDPTVSRNAKRLLVAMYRLSHGVPGVELHRDDVLAEIEREALFDISDEQFAVYHRRAVDEVRGVPNESNTPKEGNG